MTTINQGHQLHKYIQKSPGKNSRQNTEGFKEHLEHSKHSRAFTENGINGINAHKRH